MKFTLSATLFFLPLAIFASPVPETDSPAPAVAPDQFTSDADLDTRAIFARAPQNCKITNASGTVNCRSGPGTGYRVTHLPDVGTTYRFQCYKTGTCHNGNW